MGDGNTEVYCTEHHAKDDCNYSLKMSIPVGVLYSITSLATRAVHSTVAQYSNQLQDQ